MTALAGLIEELLEDEFEANPLLASGLGLTGYDDRLPDLSASAWQRRAVREDHWLGRLREVSEGSLTDPEDRADRDLAVATLRGRQIMRDWSDWRRNPDHYTAPGLSGVFGLFLHRLRPDADLCASAVARLEATPDLLAQGRANLDPELASPLLVRRALGQARSAVTYTGEQVALHVDDAGLRTRLDRAGAVAAAAYAEFVPFLEGLEQSARGGWAIGEARYDALLREREGLAYGARGLHERGLAAYAGLESEIRDLTRSLRGHDDWRRLLDELNDDYPTSSLEMLAGYDDWTARSRSFLAEHDLVTLPQGEECAVVEAPDFTRSVTAVAYYIAPPPLAAGPPKGHFFVPSPPVGASPEQVTDRLKSNARFTLPTTSVHEAYPGHHWQFAHLAATQHRTIRSVFRTPYFTEGWALYAEQMMREQGFFTEPTHVIGQVEARLFRAARMVVDTALHLGEMSPEDAANFMSTKTALSPETARAEVARYCAWPTQAPSYLTGALEIGRMAAEWPGDLRSFHDRLAGSGGLPIGIAETLLLSS